MTCKDMVPMSCKTGKLPQLNLRQSIGSRTLGTGRAISN